MASTAEKKALILEHETAFARNLATYVIDRPKLSVWMILIPILFVYYFYRFQRYAEGRKTFAEHYLMSRTRALDEAFHALNSGREPDIDHLARLSDVPDAIRPFQADVIRVLVNHFVSLLRTDGDDFETLVRSAYRDRTNYLLFLNRLNQTEKEVYTGLTSHLRETQEEVNTVVRTIELQSEKLRREEAERILP